ncbi:diguanylate cyclase [Secundilactobacillus paracollinoides]|uniref:diguanylate cyclase domain-containing protein n=1 Tax=Secundilactobacillus paracollinoides TaxID=240427 RepID=UPI00081A8534|nr:diguanylate cyclase [Secundilactobacillus paracollinoides]ANZ64188.1 diguanylate cyclase [Secundilactobacillus paracollinoides]
MTSKHQNANLYIDVCWLLFLAAFAGTAILMALSGHLIFNTIYLFCTVVLLLMTYFWGLITGLVANLLFIAVQVVIVLYQYLQQTQDIPWPLLFWMVQPILLSVILYFLTVNQTYLQQQNRDLQTALVERGAFDTQTNLRTRVAYQEDAQVFIETNRRFNLPVATLVIKIRYYNDLRRMMSSDQLTELLQLASATIKKITRENDITYLLDRDDPTWAILIYADTDGARVATGRIKDGFDKTVQQNPDLANLALTLVVGVATWDPETMKTPSDFMNAGLRETEYDVS